MNSGTCHILNGGCEEICLPVENGRRCECDIGLKLQPDQSSDSGKQTYDKYLQPLFMIPSIFFFRKLIVIHSYIKTDRTEVYINQF